MLVLLRIRCAVIAVVLMEDEVSLSKFWFCIFSNLKIPKLACSLALLYVHISFLDCLFKTSVKRFGRLFQDLLL